MKFNKLSVILATLIILAAFGTTAFASTLPNDSRESNQPILSDQQKTEIKAKHEEFNQKWSTLSNTQKEKIYKLVDKEIDIKNQMIDEYLSFGFIDKESATIMKTKLNECKTKMREKDSFPIFDMKGRYSKIQQKN